MGPNGLSSAECPQDVSRKHSAIDCNCVGYVVDFPFSKLNMQGCAAEAWAKKACGTCVPYK